MSDWLALKPATCASMAALAEPPRPPYQSVISTGPSASSSASSGHSGRSAPSPPPVATSPSPPDVGGSLQAAATTMPPAVSRASSRCPRVRRRRERIIGVLLLGERGGGRGARSPLDRTGGEAADDLTLEGDEQ